MKKILLGTSALIALGSVAFAAEAPKMTISGSLAVVADVQSHSDNGKLASPVKSVNTSGNTTGHDIINDTGYMSEIHFAGTGKTDSGLTYGAKYELRPLSNSLDEAFIHFGGDWGKITLGQDDNSGADFTSPGSWLATNGYDGLGVFSTASSSGKAEFISPYVGGWSDASRVKYSSPSIAGFKVGADFAPVQGDYTNVATVAASYSAKMGGASLGLNGAYSTGKASTAGNGGLSNLREWHVGTSVDVGAISVAATLRNTGKVGTVAQSNVGSSTYKDIGVSYAVQDGLTISSAYSVVTTKTDRSIATVTKDASWSLLSVGASTSIAAGASAFVEFNMASGDNTGDVNTLGKWRTNQVLLGTQISF